MPRCAYCSADEALVFSCKYCGGRFCVEHRIPEMHACDMVKAYEPVTVLREVKKLEFKPKSSRLPRLPRLKIPGVNFSKRELRDMLIAILLFFFAFLRFNQQFNSPSLFAGSYSSMVFMLATLGFGASLAFLVHELAHKFMAAYLGSSATFKLDAIGVAVTAISALAGLPVIVPGAVNITSYGTDKEAMGKIALAGPFTNLAMALIARAFSWNAIVSPLISLNILFAFVNLLPVFILDGRKIFQWSRLVWCMALVSALAVLASWLF